MSNILQSYTLDNMGHIVADPDQANPVFGAGQELVAIAANTDYTFTAKTGKLYVVTLGASGTMFFGVSGVTTAEANKEWICPAYGQIIMFIPMVKSDGGAPTRSVHFSSDTEGAKGYIVECKDRNSQADV